MSLADAQILRLSAGELAAAVRAGSIAAVEATRAYLAQIEATAPRVRAYVRVEPELALAEAAAVDAARARGERLGPLAGVPYGVKDSFVTAGIPTTAGSRILAGWVPPYDCAAVSRLRAAGAVLLGKLALDEFGMGSTGEHTSGGGPRNPWSLDHVPGGSSSGPAAAVAARAAAFAIGSDTGGSIRVPAALCGVVGVRPTWGRVSRHGLVAFASSLDAVGPLAREVGDAARVLACLAGQDPQDSTSLASPVPDYPAIAVQAAARGLGGVKLGVDRRALGRAGLDPDVEGAFATALDVLATAGASIVEVALPDEGEALAAYAALSAAEAASNLARYDGLRYGLHVPGDTFEASAAATRGAGFGAEVKRRLVLGALVQGDPDLLARARAARARVAAGYAVALAGCDLLVGPTTPAPAGRMGHVDMDMLHKTVGAGARAGGGRGGAGVGPSASLDVGGAAAPDAPVDLAARVLAALWADRFTVGASLAGLPALSLPGGFTWATPARPGLPVGLQLVGPRLSEARLLALAAAYEARAPWRYGVAPGAAVA